MSLELTFNDMRELAIRTLGGRPPSKKRGKFAKPKQEKRVKLTEVSRGRRQLDVHGKPIRPIELNPVDTICLRCIKSCKQHAPSIVMYCPFYIKAGTAADPNAAEFLANKALQEANQSSVKTAKAARKVL
jgi:hypothetical protein